VTSSKMVDATGHPGNGAGGGGSQTGDQRADPIFEWSWGELVQVPRRTSWCANCAGVHRSGAGVLFDGWARDNTSAWWPRGVEATRAGIGYPGWTRLRRVRRTVRGVWSEQRAGHVIAICPVRSPPGPEPRAFELRQARDDQPGARPWL